MAEERRQFARRWPHMTSLYNASPFVSKPYKEVEEWNSLRPLPSTAGPYPYEDTDPTESYGAYRAQRNRSPDKFGRSFATSPSYNYDAFSTSTFNSLPNERKRRKARSTGCLACFIGLSLIAAVIGAVVVVILVYSRKNDEVKCDRYRENVTVINAPYEHEMLVKGCDHYDNFTTEFCIEIKKAYDLIVMDHRICGCEIFTLSARDKTINVTLDILYERRNDSDDNDDYVGMVLGSALDRIISQSLVEKFVLINPYLPVTTLKPTLIPTDATKTSQFGNETASTSLPSRTTVSSQVPAKVSVSTSSTTAASIFTRIPTSQQQSVTPMSTSRQRVSSSTTLLSQTQTLPTITAPNATPPTISTSAVLPGAASNVPPMNMSTTSRVVPVDASTRLSVASTTTTTIIRSEVAFTVATVTVASTTSSGAPEVISSNIQNRTSGDSSVNRTPLPPDSVSLKEPITVANPSTTTSSISEYFTTAGSQAGSISGGDGTPTRPSGPHVATTAAETAQTTGVLAARVTDTPTGTVSTQNTPQSNTNYTSRTVSNPESVSSNSSSEMHTTRSETTRAIP